MYPTQTIFCVLQTPHFYNPAGAVAPAPFTGGSLLCLCEHCGCAPCFSVRGIPYAPASGINLIFVGEGLPLPFCRAIRLYKTILCPLHNLFPYPLFLCRCRRKEKAIKKKRHANIPAANILTLLPAAGARKRGLFIKSPLLTPSKIFRQLTPGIGRVHPTDSESPAAGGRRWRRCPAKTFRRLVPVIRRGRQLSPGY